MHYADEATNEKQSESFLEYYQHSNGTEIEVMDEPQMQKTSQIFKPVET